VPVKVLGGFGWRQVTAGNGHTCGVTLARKAYCWGLNLDGQLGDGTTTNRSTPRAVAGGLTFNQTVAGVGHSCGVTVGHLAYCWGDNFTGALGDGTETDRVTPVAVLGGIQFSGVSPGGSAHNCGVATDRRVYCWGHNVYGQLGNGTSTGPETCMGELACGTKPEEIVGAS
jgi:alpha-tubulin suppressor-like RCC1 family protein